MLIQTICSILIFSFTSVFFLGCGGYSALKIVQTINEVKKDAHTRIVVSYSDYLKEYRNPFVLFGSKDLEYPIKNVFHEVQSEVYNWFRVYFEKRTIKKIGKKRYTNVFRAAREIFNAAHFLLPDSDGTKDLDLFDVVACNYGKMRFLRTEQNDNAFLSIKYPCKLH